MKPADLRAFPTEWLQRELMERKRCIECHTEWSSGWRRTKDNRIICADCDKKQMPLFIGANS